MSSVYDSKKMYLCILGLPLLFLLLASWQIYRSYSPSDIQTKLHEVEAIVAELTTLQQEKGPTFRVEIGSGKTEQVSTVIRHGKNYIESLETNLLIALFSTIFSWGTCATALAALLIGAAGTLYIRSLGQKALTSRESLLHLFLKGQKVLPWILGGAGLALTLAVACAVLYELTMFLTYGITGRGVGKVYIGGIVFALALLWCGLKLVWNIFKSCRETFATSELTVMGRVLGQEEAPALWDFVRSVSSNTQTVMPDTIIVGLDEGFFVTENPVKLHKSDTVTTGRVLYLPLPYMAFMSRAETATIIAHELGHFTGADTEYSLRFAPIYNAAINNLSAVYTTAENNEAANSWVAKPTILLGHYFLDSFHEAVQFWSRERELAADAVGAKAADAATFAAALMRVVSLSPHVNRALGIFWNQAGEGESSVLALVHQSIRDHGFADMEERLNEQFPHPTDSHPTLTQRLGAQNIPIDEQLLLKAANVAESGLLAELGLEQDPAQRPMAQNGSEASGVSSITKYLEADFAQEAAQTVHEQKEQLTALAQEGTDTLVVYERKSFVVIVLMILGLLSLTQIMFIGQHPVRALVSVAVALVLFITGNKIRKGSKRPVVAMDAEGLTLHTMSQPILWHQINDMDIREDSYNGVSVYTMQFFLEQGTPVPALTGRKVKYKQKENMLQMRMSKLVKISMDDFFESLFAHWRGGNARAHLMRMEKGASSKE